MQNLYCSNLFTATNVWTSGIEGPACDVMGNLFAVNYQYDGTIGRVSPDGYAEVFVELPHGSIGNGIRFNSKGEMLVADYTGHNLFKINLLTRKIDVLVHEASMHQPNDIAITTKDIVFASDPNWENLSDGRLWRILSNGEVSILDSGMGTVNGIEVSPDEHTLYVNESEQRNVWAYDLSSDGQIDNKRLLINFPDFGLDGMRCDVLGNLYITRYHKGTILKVSPEGIPLLEVYLSGKRCSNLCFGGIDGCTCYVTMADTGCVETFRCEHPGRDWALYRRWNLADQ